MNNINSGFAVDRKEGYIDALKENNINIKYNFIKSSNFSKYSVYKVTDEIMKNNKKPTAIVTCSDIFSIQVLNYLKEKGYKVPNDVSIFGMGDMNISEVVTPKLSTINFYHKASGALSAKLLLSLMVSNSDFKNKNSKKIKLKYRIKLRDSVK